MSSETALLRAIQEDPDDDLPRQVLADWLDDTGDVERAEFVRLQLELAGGAGDGSAGWLYNAGLREGRCGIDDQQASG